LRNLASGIEVCVTVTLFDGLVLARSAFHHSMNYRSVVVFGTALPVEDKDEKTNALRVISEQILKGRWADVRPPNPKELKATSVLALPISDASAKIRTGPPADDEEDYSLKVWAGILPVRQTAGDPIPDARLAAGLEKLPSYLEKSFV
jgi:uncharacterized protein